MSRLKAVPDTVSGTKTTEEMADTAKSPWLGVPPHRTLAAHHARYLEERGVDIRRSMQGFWTARKPSEIPEAFSSYQRRGAPALVSAFYSPDRETIGYQMYSDYPRKDRDGKRIKWMSPPKERARMVLGVAPGLVDQVREGAGSLWAVEGITRGAALASFGIPSVAFAGCWGWQKDGDPLECWRHVNLRSRLVLVAFDADYRTNANVYKALKGFVSFLEEQGARVLVVDVPEVGGDPNTGLDDWIAANGQPVALERSAQPLAFVDVTRERLKRDERLRLFITAKRHQVDELPTRTGPECNAVKVARLMVEGSAPEHGKTEGDGVVVHPSFPQIAEGVRFGSFQTVRKAIDLLESIRFLERVKGPRGKREAASYLLLPPWGRGSGQSVNMREQGGQGKESLEYREKEETLLYQRDSSSCLHSTRGGDEDARNVPALRNSKLVHTYVHQDGRRVVVHSDYLRRYGPKLGEIIRYVVAGGGADEGELWGKFGSEKSRLRDFRRTWLERPLEDGVLVRDGTRILPAADWREALERVRERTDEEEDNRLQSEKYAERRRKYLQAKDTVADPTPRTPGKENVRHLLQDAEQRDEVARLEEQRSKVGVAVEVFIHDTLANLGKIRMGLLMELWRDKGGNDVHVWPAVRRLGCKLEKLPEHDNALFVFPSVIARTEPTSREQLATVVPIRRDQTREAKSPTVALLEKPRPGLPEKVDGVFIHDSLCECDWCENEPAAPYAELTTRGSA